MEENIKIIPRYRVTFANENVNKPSKRNNKRKTTEEYKEELKIKNYNIEVLEEYINAKTKILHRCFNGHIFKAYPSNILKGHGCKICSQTKTHDEYVAELSDKMPTIKILDTYIGVDYKNTFYCTICANTWIVTPSNPLRGKGCPECAKVKIGDKLRHTHEQFVKQVKDIDSSIKLLEEYTDSRNSIKSMCLICGNIWSPIAHTLLQGHGCPCIRRMLEEEFYTRARISCPDIIIKSPYTKATDKYLCECKICNYQWSINGNAILRGKTGCKKCNNNSNGEKIISDFLYSLDVYYISQHKYHDLVGMKNGLLSYDFYLPIYNLLIEFQGIQHEQPIEYFGGEEQFEIQQEHDKRKREYAKQNNINLLEIWYYDIDNIEEILTNTLNNLKLESLETATSA